MARLSYLTGSLQNGLKPRLLIRCMAFAILPALLFYASSLQVLRHYGFGIIQIIRDPAQQSDTSSFIGFLSNIGVSLWVSAAAIALFTLISASAALNRKHKELLLLLAGMSLLLGVDDFFMIHDRYINERHCFFAYAVFAGLLLLRHFHNILKIEGYGFLVAGGFLCLSIVTDLFQDTVEMPYQYNQIIEEGFKFLGGATWLYFVGKVAAYRQLPNPIVKLPVKQELAGSRNGRQIWAAPHPEETAKK